MTITAPSGSTYVLDGANPAAVPSNGVITVSAPGNHTITVTDPANDVATRAFSISTTQTTTTVVPSANPGATGQPITYTATVNAASSGGGSPSGYVEFLDGGNPILACGGAGGALLNGSTAACQVTYTLPGPHQITAEYLGNSSFAPSTTSSPLSETVNPGQVAASTSLGASTTSPTVGQLVTYTATVSGPTNGATPTGSVTFEDGSNPITCTGGTQTLAGSANTATATCQVTYTSTAGSPHSITAVYVPGSDPNYTAGAPSSAISVTVGTALPTELVSTMPASPTLGQQVTYTATVTGPPGAVTPTGTAYLDPDRPR